jgi:hypothetical protein
MKGKTGDYFIAALLGSALGIIHGVVMWGAMNTGYYINEGGLGGTGSLDMKTATFIPISYIFYSDKYTLPLQVAAIADIIGLMVILTSGVWTPKALYIIEKLGEEIGEGRREEEEEKEDRE